MANFIVTTGADIENPGDGALSLREAVAAANTTRGGDTITFAEGFSIVDIDEGEIEIAASGAVLIDGDRNNDGLADVIILAGQNRHFTVLQNAEVELSGMVFATGSGPSEFGDLDGERGEEGSLGARGFDRKDLILDERSIQDLQGFVAPADLIRLQENGGREGGPGVAGGDGGAGENGGDAEVQAGSIVNYGNLTLTQVGFGGNFSQGQKGGQGGPGGNAGFSGEGGDAVEGSRSGGAGFNGVINGGDGGRGGDGGIGGRGGDGGDGGDAAGAIFNDSGAFLSMTDVAFGGTLPTLGIFNGNMARAGGGGTAGFGGSGTAGGQGGDGGFAGSVDPGQAAGGIQFGNGGIGGDGGDGGPGGHGGEHGDSGDAAGAILNDGLVTGKAAFVANSGTTTDMDDAFVDGIGGGFLGVAAFGGIGKRLLSDGSSVRFADDGQSGLQAVRGDPFVNGETGETSAILFNQEMGRSSVEGGSVLVYAHGVTTQAEEESGLNTLEFNLVRLGAVNGTVTINWEIKGFGDSKVSGSDFAGGKLPKGVAVLEPAELDALFHGNAVERVKIEVALDSIAEEAETFQFVITNVRYDGSGVARLGTSSILGTIGGEKGPGDPTGPTEGTSGNDKLKGTKKDDEIDGLKGNDVIKGKSGDDILNGGKGNDKLVGQGGDDVLSGGAGKDIVIGSAGADMLDGGRSNDTLKGGGGSDSFFFGKKYGHDTIADFKDNVDTLMLDDALWKGTLSVRKVIKRYASVEDDDVVFDFGKHTLTLDGFDDLNALRNDIDIA